MAEGVLVAVGGVGVGVAVLDLGGDVAVAGRVPGLDEVCITGDTVVIRLVHEGPGDDPGEEEEREQGHDRRQYLVIPDERVPVVVSGGSGAMGASPAGTPAGWK